MGYKSSHYRKTHNRKTKSGRTVRINSTHVRGCSTKRRRKR